MNQYLDMTTEELEAEEARLSADIQALDEEIAERREQMRELAVEVDPIRAEIERRKRAGAANDPRTQGIGD